MQLILIDADGRKIDGTTKWSPEQASAFLGTSQNMLHKWRSVGGGPRFRKGDDGWSVHYLVVDIVEWLNVRRPWTQPSRQKRAA